MPSTMHFFRIHKKRIFLTLIFLLILLYSYGCMCAGAEQGKKADDRGDGSESSEDRATIRNEICRQYGGKFCEFDCKEGDQACINFVQDLSRPTLEATKLVQGTQFTYQTSYHIEVSTNSYVKVYLSNTQNAVPIHELLTSTPVTTSVNNEEHSVLSQDFQKICAEIKPVNSALAEKTYCEDIVASYGPSFNNVPATQTLTEDQNISITVGATDQDCVDSSCQLSYSVENTSGIATINPTTGLILFTPRQEHVERSPFNMAVIVFDAEGHSQTKQIAITVNGVNDAPQIIGLTDIFMREDTPYQFDLYEFIFDPDDSLSELTVLPVIQGDVKVELHERTLKLTPDENFEGTKLLTVTVTDPHGAPTSKTVNVHVNNQNDAPYFTMNFPDKILREDFNQIIIPLDNYIADRDDQKSTLTLTPEVMGDDIIVAQIVSHTLKLKSIKDKNGETNVRITLSDTKAEVSQFMKVVVNPENDPPRFTQTGIQVVLTNAQSTKTINLKDLVVDPDDPEGEHLQFDVRTKPDFTHDLIVAPTSTSRTFSKKPDSSDFFSYLFFVTVYDTSYASDFTTLSVSYTGS